jgi:hypothetical protein
MKRFDCSGSSGWGFGFRAIFLLAAMLVDLCIAACLHALEPHANRGHACTEAAHSGVPVAFVTIFLEFSVRQSGFCEGSNRA